MDSSMEVFITALESAAKAYDNKEAARIANEWRKHKSVSGGDYNAGRRILAEIAERRYDAKAKLSRQANARKVARTAKAEAERLAAALEKVRKARERFE